MRTSSKSKDKPLPQSPSATAPRNGEPFPEKPPLVGEVTRSGRGVQSAGRVNLPRSPFTIEDLHKRGLIWDTNSLPHNPNLIKYARNLRKGMTPAERKIWYDFLRNHQHKFYRQRPIDHFIADFYCYKCALIIEIDGSQHYTPDGLKRDAIRSDILSLYGLEIVRFTNNEILKRFDTVCSAINTKLQTLSVRP